MDITITPGKLHGTIAAISSKSQAHRLLICAAFADKETHLNCSDTNRDIEATVDCLNALGAEIKRTQNGYNVLPICNVPKTATLNCHESGSTLRFMLPIVGALGVDATFLLSGRLPQRPLSPLWEEIGRMGCHLSRPTDDTIRCQGKLRSGFFSIAGNVSSQFITGLLFATALMAGDSRIEIIGALESKPYVEMTQQTLTQFGVDTAGYEVKGRQIFCSPRDMMVEGDWSNGAFWLAAKALGCPLEVTNLRTDSLQGDREVVNFLHALNYQIRIDGAQTPDLIPILAIVAGAKQGSTFVNCGRLRLKETDRLETTAAMIRALGGWAEIIGDSLIVKGTGFRGGTVDAKGDHRIAMSAAIAATVSTGPVTVLNAHEVKKSYPGFWEDYEKLGGKYELYLR
jgi:3-phosphoshikimate 1-carboxyvinyltransferase